MARFLSDYEKEPVRLTRPYPCVRETLETLWGQGYRLGVCTNKPEHLARAVLAGLDLARFFEAIIGADTVGARKPDPASLLAAHRQLGSLDAAAVMIGDSGGDVAAARGGPPDRAHDLTHGYSRVEPATLAPDALADTFAALPEIVAELASRGCGHHDGTGSRTRITNLLPYPLRAADRADAPAARHRAPRSESMDIY